MNDRQRAYYDVPVTPGPSANFANRPITDISGLLLVDETFMISSSSSSSLSDAADVPAAALESPTTPTIRVTFPNEEEQQPRGRSMNNDENVADRPRLRKKSATAPPGGIATSAPGYAPQLPRRAISARVGETEGIQGRTPQQTYGTNPWSAREVQQSERSKRPPQSPRLPPSRPPRSEELERPSSEVTIRAPSPESFSQKARVRKTLESKNVGRLNTRIVDYESRGLLSSPTSMLNTPCELYRIAEKHPAGNAHWRADPYGPHSVDARWSILSSISPRSQQSHRVRSRKKGSKRSRQAEKQRIYVPGPIRLEGHRAQLRKGSDASLGPFDEGAATKGKKYSDTIVLNSMTMYFAELSVLEDASEACLDRYWRDTKPPVPRHVVKPSVSSIEEIPIVESPRRPSITSTTRGSRFSSSSASSSSTTAPMRQRDRLKRLLTPGFTSSGKWIP